MALRDYDGFDYYARGDISSLYNIVGTSWKVTAGAGRFGSGALTHDPSGGNEIVSRFFDDQSVWVVGFAYKFTVTGHANLIVSVDYSGSKQLELGMNASNQLCIYKNGTLLATGTVSLLANTFYFVEFKATVGTSVAAGAVKARLNGVDEVAVSAGTNTDPQASGKANRVNIWYDYFNNGNTYDDLYICDGTGSSPGNDFLGDCRVETGAPSGAGTYTEFTTLVGAASHYLAVSEATEDGDTSYLGSATVGQRETYALPDLSSIPAAIYGVKTTIIARKDDAGSRGLTPLLRIASTDYLGSQRGLTDTYTYSSQVYTTNPATSLAWTYSDVNALEAGFKLTL